MVDPEKLEVMSLAELKTLQKRVDKAVAGYGEKQLAAAASRVGEICEELGVSLPSLVEYLAAAKGAKKPRSLSAAQPKYRHKSDHSKTWSGRGRAPRWMEEFGEVIAST